jgi:signal transduction histidine kinase
MIRDKRTHVKERQYAGDDMDEQVNDLVASELVAVLRDLARMTEYASSADSDHYLYYLSPGEGAGQGADSVANRLLEYLLVLCAAERGALFLRAYPSKESAEDFRSSDVSSSTLHHFALHGISEAEAQALLQLFPTGDASIKTASGEHFWVVYRLPLTAPFVALPGQEEPGRAIIEQEPGQSFEAVLLLGRPGHEDAESRSATVEKGRVILPLVTEAIGAVIVNILLAKRVHELETALKNRPPQEMELLKSELLATVSHELRTPLASIKGYAATLLRHEHRISLEERREFLVEIGAASDRLERIIDRLLEMSQLEGGTMRVERSPVDVVRMAQEAILTAEQHISAPSPGHFTFHLRLRDASGFPTQEEPLIMADSRRLREVLDNLLDNAINYSPEGGVIEVVVQPVQALLPDGQPSRSNGKAEALPVSDNDHIERTGVQLAGQKVRQMVEICVCDNGLGIPTEHLERIFDRFHRVDKRLTREQSGLGLGLTICKHIVELHDGLIWAESCPDGGSALHVRLPVDKEEQYLAPLVAASER